MKERNRLKKFDYALSLKMLDHIEATADGKMADILLTGSRMTV